MSAEMTMTRQTTFDTPFGPTTLHYTTQGITSLSLRPPSSKQATPDAHAPAWVQDVVNQVQEHFAGKLQDFSNVPLDIEGMTPFYRDVYDAARKIPPGKTVTYGELAKIVGRPAAARAVGQALSKNPILLIVPCHRIVGAAGAAVGFSAPGGVQTKAKMLALEGAKVPRISRVASPPA